jgi:hypothetical protein
MLLYSVRNIPKANVIPAALCAYKKSHIGVFQNFYPARNLHTGVNVFVVMICGMYSGILLCFISQDVFADLLFVDSDWLGVGRSGCSVPVETGFSALAQTVPGAHSAPCTVVTGFPYRG